MNTPLRTALLAAALLAGGCTALDPAAPAASAGALTERALGARAAPAEAAVPTELDMEQALALSLARNPRIQSALAGAGLEAAEIRQATRLSNPVLSASRISGGGTATTHLALEWVLLDALLAPARTRLAAQDYQRLAHRTAHALFSHGQAVRSAWLELAGAEAALEGDSALASAFEAAARLAARQRAAGNLNPRDQSRLQADYAAFMVEQARHRLEAVQARERLNALMGLWGDDAARWRPAPLPALPAQRPSLPQPEAIALAHRLDVSAARLQLEREADRLKLSRSTRWVDLLGIGIETERETHGDRQSGPSLSASLPLLDDGGDRLGRDAQAYRKALFELRALAVEVRAEVRQQYAAWQIDYDIARHQRDALVPLRRQITAESLKHYNGMLQGVHELLADARAQQRAEQDALLATQAFWRSQAALEAALGTPIASAAAPAATAAPAQEHHHGQP